MAWDVWLRARHDRRRGIFPRAICLECGYDLRASKDRCPECGTSVAQSASTIHPPVPSLLRRIAVPFFALGLALTFISLIMPPTISGRTEDPKIKAVQAEISGISTALDYFQRDTGRYPTTQEGLAALVTAPPGLAGWKSPYLTSLPVDPWGHPYFYHTQRPGDDRDFVVSSAGPDGREGTKDDISSW